MNDEGAQVCVVMLNALDGGVDVAVANLWL